jgi:hypothetical protein
MTNPTLEGPHFRPLNVLNLHPTADSGELAVPSAPASAPVHWVSHLFGCWHWHSMSRPITLYGETYSTCTRCGAHRRYDLDRGQSTGGYYYHPVSP